jgi:hypothetical protein
MPPPRARSQRARERTPDATDYPFLNAEKDDRPMPIRSIRHEIRVLRVYALVTTLLAGVFLLGAVHEARLASFDRLTVHRIDVVDREGKLAMVLAAHDDFPPPVVNGKPVTRSSGSDENGIVFFNQRGDEQGALMWDGRVAADGSYSSANTLSYDSVRSDQLLQVDDATENGRQSAYVIGWNRPDDASPVFKRYIADMLAARDDRGRSAVARRYPQMHAPVRFLVGYGTDNAARVALNDGRGRTRIDMAVTADGRATLEFLDAHGKVVARLPR